jgi:YD repeat-containing protein
MNSHRTGFLIMGLATCFLLGGSIYFFLTPRINSVSVESLAFPAAKSTSPSPPQSTSLPRPSYQYNARGQLQTINYPNGSTYNYAYDSSGDKVRETDGSGKTWSYVYDQNHRPISVIDPDGKITYKATSPTPPPGAK